MIVRAKHNGKTAPYSIISRQLLQENQLPHGPKCLLLLMMSYPDNWNFTVEFLSQMMSEPIETIQAWLDVLNHFGYFHRDVALKVSDDSYVPISWLVSEYPIDVKGA